MKRMVGTWFNKRARLIVTLSAGAALVATGLLVPVSSVGAAVGDCSSGTETVGTADELQQAITACTAGGAPTTAEILVTADFNPKPSVFSAPSVYPINVASGKTLTIRSSTSALRILDLGGAFDLSAPRMFAKSGTGTLVIERIGFKNIQANEAGPVIQVTAGDLDIIDSEFIDNFTNGTGNQAAGGAVFFGGEGTLSVSGTTFARNAAENTSTGSGGGAIYADDTSTVAISNSTFTENKAFQLAGGIFIKSGSLTMEFVTMDGNMGDQNFSGTPDANNLQVMAGSLTLRGTVIGSSENSSVASCSIAIGVVVDDSYSISESTGCGVVDGVNGGAIKTAAEINLGALADNGGPTQTMMPAFGSALRDYAPDALGTGIVVDQRGDPRSGLYAVGSVQAFPPPPPCAVASNFSGGTGSPNDPYLVANATQLAYLTDVSCLGLDFRQMNNITLSGAWTPIGSAAQPFTGTYDGDGYQIAGLSVSGSGNDLGLFGRVKGVISGPAKIENLSVAGTVAGNTGSSDYVGGLVGYLEDYSTVENVTSSVTVSGNEYVGGLVGRAYKSSSPLGPQILTSSATGFVDSGDDYAGGLVGQVYWGTVSSSSATGDVRDDTTAADGGVGGLIGQSYESIIGSSFSSGDVRAQTRAGGLIGHADDNSQVNYSYAEGDVTTDPTQSGETGGLVGFLEDGADVLNSYASGAVIGSDPRTGGLIGRVQFSSVTVTNSYSRGSVTQGNSSGGGLIGTLSGTVSGSFWNPTAAAPAVTSAGGSESTVASMTQIALYDDTNWNIASDWEPFNAGTADWGICSAVNDGYPFLLWQYSANPCAAPNPPAPVVPSAPRDVTAAGGNASAVVSWREPASAGSFPVSTYKATSSPGGRTCLVTAAVTSCDVTGLTNGTTYTFTVEALSGAGWSPAGGPSNPVTPGGVTPAPAPVPLPQTLAPGESLLQTNGVVDPNVVVDPNAQDNGLRITGDNWSMDLDGLGPDGKPLNLGPDGSLRLANERDVATEGSGFLPNSDVDLYVDPPVQVTGASTRVGARSTEAIYVGTVRTDARGNFIGTATLPEDIEPGEHVLQAVGYSPTAQSRAMSLGVIVERWIVLDQGTRKSDGRHDRIRTTGATGGIDAGVRLTPWIKYSGQKAFKQGKATIRVQSDGSFRWTREIRKSRGLTAYVSYLDTDSNRVFWAKVR